MFRWIEHTGELELELEAASAEEVFADALAALAELLGDGREERTRDVTVSAEDAPGLLAAWLEELAFLAETEGFVPAAIESLELGDRTLRARVLGRAGEPPHLVKAVTYHRLELAGRDGAWHGRAVLDV